MSTFEYSFFKEKTDYNIDDFDENTLKWTNEDVNFACQDILYIKFFNNLLYLISDNQYFFKILIYTLKYNTDFEEYLNISNISNIKLILDALILHKNTSELRAYEQNIEKKVKKVNNYIPENAFEEFHLNKMNESFDSEPNVQENLEGKINKELIYLVCNNIDLFKAFIEFRYLIPLEINFNLNCEKLIKQNQKTFDKSILDDLEPKYIFMPNEATKNNIIRELSNYKISELINTNNQEIFNNVILKKELLLLGISFDLKSDEEQYPGLIKNIEITDIISRIKFHAEFSRNSTGKFKYSQNGVTFSAPKMNIHYIYEKVLEKFDYSIKPFLEFSKNTSFIYKNLREMLENNTVFEMGNFNFETILDVFNQKETDELNKEINLIEQNNRESLAFKGLIESLKEQLTNEIEILRNKYNGKEIDLIKYKKLNNEIVLKINTQIEKTTNEYNEFLLSKKVSSLTILKFKLKLIKSKIPYFDDFIDNPYSNKSDEELFSIFNSFGKIIKFKFKEVIKIGNNNFKINHKFDLIKAIYYYEKHYKVKVKYLENIYRRSMLRFGFILDGKTNKGLSLGLTPRYSILSDFIGKLSGYNNKLEEFRGLIHYDFFTGSVDLTVLKHKLEEEFNAFKSEQILLVRKHIAEMTDFKYLEFKEINSSASDDDYYKAQNIIIKQEEGKKQFQSLSKILDGKNKIQRLITPMEGLLIESLEKGARANIENKIKEKEIIKKKYLSNPLDFPEN